MNATANAIQATGAEFMDSILARVEKNATEKAMIELSRLDATAFGMLEQVGLGTAATPWNAPKAVTDEMRKAYITASVHHARANLARALIALAD